MTTTNNYKIDALTSDNYITWQRCLKWTLDNLELWEVTNGLETEPIPLDPRIITPAKQTAINKWKKKDKKAKKEISLRVSTLIRLLLHQNYRLVYRQFSSPRWQSAQ